MIHCKHSPLLLHAIYDENLLTIFKVVVKKTVGLLFCGRGVQYNKISLKMQQTYIAKRCRTTGMKHNNSTGCTDCMVASVPCK